MALFAIYFPHGCMRKLARLYILHSGQLLTLAATHCPAPSYVDAITASLRLAYHLRCYFGPAAGRQAQNLEVLMPAYVEHVLARILALWNVLCSGYAQPQEGGRRCAMS